MSPLKHSNNIAARMGRWSASHWKTAVFGWLAFVVVAFGIATQLPMKTISTQDQNVGQAHRADEIFKKSGFKQTDSQTEFVLIQSKTLTVKDRAFRAVIADVTSTVTPFKTIKNFRSPLDPAHPDQVSPDGHTAIVGWDMKGNDTVAQKNIDPITTATARSARSASARSWSSRSRCSALSPCCRHSCRSSGTASRRAASRSSAGCAARAARTACGRRC